jgi:hypothetical protein
MPPNWDIVRGKKIKKLSKTGKTKFEIDNLDFGFLHNALDNYKIMVEGCDFPSNSIMTKGFVLQRIKSLKETFKVGE